MTIPSNILLFNGKFYFYLQVSSINSYIQYDNFADSKCTNIKGTLIVPLDNECYKVPVNSTQTAFYNIQQDKSDYSVGIYSDSKCEKRLTKTLEFKSTELGSCVAAMIPSGSTAPPNWFVPTALSLDSTDIVKYVQSGADTTKYIASKTTTKSIQKKITATTTASASTSSLSSSAATSVPIPTRDSNNGQSIVVSSLLGLTALFVWL